MEALGSQATSQQQGCNGSSGFTRGELIGYSASLKYASQLKSVNVPSSFWRYLGKARSWTQHLHDFKVPNLNLEFRVEKTNVFQDGSQAEQSLTWQLWVGVARGVALTPSQALRLNLKSTPNLTVHHILNVF